MPEVTRQQKITFGEMRGSGVRLVYCSDYRCSHCTAINADQWPDDVRLSDIEPRFTCQACGQRGADVRPNFGWEQERCTGKLNEHHPETCGAGSGGRS
jgi:DNA-directed RNA polymerase subunit RPC12/RpoP